MKTRTQVKLFGLCLASITGNLGALGADCVSASLGLVSWWRGEDNALDQFGTNHGVMLNGATFAPGWVGQAFSFDGVNDGVSIPDDARLKPATNLTIECWIKTPGVPEQLYIGMIAATYRDGGVYFNYGYEFFIDAPSNGGRLGFLLNGGAAACFGTGTVTDNVFHHVAATYNGAVLRLYRDGTLNKEVAYTQSIAYAAGIPSWIGRRDFAPIPGYFVGLIDELSIYDRALTESEIAAIYGAGSAGKCGPMPRLNIAALPGAVRLTWTTNATGYVIETNNTLTFTAGWGVLTSNYNVLNADFAVTNSIGGATRFYRLHKP